jgi:hypothetical protein
VTLIQRFSLVMAVAALTACGPITPQTQLVPPPPTSHAVGVQTHFGALVGADTLTALRAFGFEIVRIDAQTSDIDTTLAMIEEAQAAGLRPLVIISQPEHLYRLPEGLNYELRNEPDLNGLPPSAYAALVLKAAEIARRRRQQLWIGAVSNLNERGFNYLRDIGPLPDDVGVSVHRYGDGTFEHAHDGFATRESEVAQLRALIGNRPFGVSEFGYPTNREGWGPFASQITPDQAATLIGSEIAFWARVGASWSVIFQLNDGPTERRENRYGIRAFDGTWKPAARVLGDRPPLHVINRDE